MQYKRLLLVVRKLWPRLTFFKVGQTQGQGHEVKNYGTMRKVLSQATNMCNIKALSLLVRTLWTKLKFLFTHTRGLRHGRGR